MMSDHIGGEPNDKTNASVKTNMNESLREAIMQQRVDDARYYIKMGADINYIDQYNMSSLEHSFTCLKLPEKEKFITELIQKGVNFNNSARNGQSDIMTIVYDAFLPYDYITGIADKIENVSETNLLTGGGYLHILSRRLDDKGRTNLMAKLCKAGLSVNTKDNNGDSPLHVMAGIADPDAPRFLMDNGANINATNRNGENVIHSLAGSNELPGFPECLHLLVQQGISINAVDCKGRTALHHALQAKQTTTSGLKELLNYRIITNVEDSLGRNEIYAAVKYINHSYSDDELDEREDILKFLSENGIDVNKGDINGVTALHLAVSTVNCSMLCIIGCLLYDLEADAAARTKLGATPLHWACRSFNQTMIILDAYGNHELDVNVSDDFGSTALHWAVWFREISVARLLLQRGVDPSLTDELGDSPGELAKKVHLDSFTDLLENYQVPLYDDLVEHHIECSEDDSIFPCQQLRYVGKTNDTIQVEEYIQHVKLHQNALKTSIDTVVFASNMGLYYDIDENDEVPSLINDFLHLVAGVVSKKNPLFHGILCLAGSNLERTKVNLPDEFDYLWKLAEFSKAFSPVESVEFPDGFIKLRLTKANQQEPKFRRYVNTNGDLDSKLLLEDLFCAINAAVSHVMEENTERFKRLTCTRNLNEIAYSIDNLVFNYCGRHAKTFSISVDIVPTVSLGGFKPGDFKEDDHPLLQTLGDKWEWSAVTKTPDRLMVQDFTLYHRLSFAVLEQSILQGVPSEVRKGYIVLKSLAETKYAPRCVDNDRKKRIIRYITSYQMKNAFLFELDLEKRENTVTKANDEVARERHDTRMIAFNWARRILSHLERRFQSLFLPSYFQPRRSIFGLAGFSDAMVDPGPHKQQVALIKKLLDICETSDDVTDKYSSL